MGLIENSLQDKWPDSVIIHTDGACRGNPGPSSVGYIVSDSTGRPVYEYGNTIGEQTNNYAEYMAVEMALGAAIKNKAQSVLLKSDSQLLVRQMQGIYKVKSPVIKPLHAKCKELSQKIPKLTFEHVRREFNKRADELANEALDC